MIRLVRQSSDIPNITNKDDVRMVRYAYGGYNGAVKNYGQSLDYTIDNTNGIFKIGSGRFVLQGWEIDLDEQGWSFNFKGVAGTRYYSIYLEVNATTEQASIIAVYNTGAYPSVSPGDDLTAVPLGTSRVELYRVIVSSGVASQITKIFSDIPYISEKIQSVDNNLSRRISDVSSSVTNLRSNIESGEIPSGRALTADSDLSGVGFTMGYSKIPQYNISGDHYESVFNDITEVDVPVGTILLAEVSTFQGMAPSAPKALTRINSTSLSPESPALTLSKLGKIEYGFNSQGSSLNKLIKGTFIVLGKVTDISETYSGDTRYTYYFLAQRVK